MSEETDAPLAPNYDFNFWTVGDLPPDETLNTFVRGNLQAFSACLVMQCAHSYGEGTSGYDDDLVIEIVDGTASGNGERMANGSTMKALIDELVEDVIDAGSGSSAIIKSMLAISDYLRQQAERLKTEAPDPPSDKP